VLPTERRFKRLSFHQKILLFKSYTVLPTDEDIRYAADLQKRGSKAELPVKDLKRMGYTTEQLDKMKKQLAAAGWGGPAL